MYVCSDFSFVCRFFGPDELWNGVLTSTVRTATAILKQPEEVQRKIRAAFDSIAKQYMKTDGLKVPISMKIGSGCKPAGS